MSIIDIQGLTFTYPGGEEPVLRDVDVAIEAGEFVAVIGSNGSGKSTLCKSLNGLIPHYHQGKFAGTVVVEGMNTLQHSVSQLSRSIGYVYQDFPNQLVRSTVGDEAIFAPLNYGLEDYKERGRKALELLGIESLQDDYIWELSGGQMHLTALASVLSLEPDIIVVDEPVAQLDRVNAHTIYEHLQALNSEHDKTIIVIEHQTEFIAEFCDSVILMDDGQVAWKQNTGDALCRVDELLKNDILPPQVTQASHRLHAVADTDSIEHPLTTDEAAVHFSRVNCDVGEPVEPGGEEPDQPESEVIVRLDNVSHGYKRMDGDINWVLKNISTELYEGERIGLVGGNGAGKSTLMRLLTGLVRPNEGQVVVAGHNTREIMPENLADYVAYVYQDPENMFLSDSVRADIEYFLAAREVAGREETIDNIIERCSLNQFENRDGRLLSGGQQRRASLAIGMAMQPTLLMLDEPTSSLDVNSRQGIVMMLAELRKWVRTVIVATHDVEMVASWADRVIVMKDGEIIADRSRWDVFGDASILREAKLRAPQIVELSWKLGMNPPALTVDEFATRLLAGEGDKIDVV